MQASKSLGGLLNIIFSISLDWDIVILLLAYCLIGLYTAALLLLWAYSLTQGVLAWHYYRFKKRPTGSHWDFKNGDPFPSVTIQLPVFNELYMMERLLKAVTNLTYPTHLLEIQVLDDSTDESVSLTAALVAQYQKQGVPIEHIQRKERTGFKAGALKAGLEVAKGDFIALFDADFLPEKNWLLQTLPYFKEKQIGLVQTRWGHLNKNYSLLTKMQAFALDAHFTLEQVGRNSQGHFINFNGTAGVWRKICIEDAGNWQGDTLTEDMDLSFRAQLNNWEFKFIESVETPAELPVTMSAIRSQQFRWNKGGAENFQKLIRKVWQNKQLSLSTKWHATIHLLSSSMFLGVFILAILSVPMLYIKAEWEHLAWYFNLASLFVLSTLYFFVGYWQMYQVRYAKGWIAFLFYIRRFVTFYVIAMGLCFHNSLAVIEGHFGKKTAFIRTPKYNITQINDRWRPHKYLSLSVSKNVWWESMLALYFLFGIYSAFTVGQEGDWGLLPFHCMLFVGFVFIVVQSFREQL